MISFRRSLTSLLLAGPLALSLAACGSPDIVTCDEFASMGDSTGLFVSLTDEQESALKDALDAEDFDTGAWNVTIARTEVIAFCNIYDGQAGSNADRPITEAL